MEAPAPVPRPAGAFYFEREDKHSLPQRGKRAYGFDKKKAAQVKQPKSREEIYPAINGGAFFWVGV
jgi:hypothetical protein